MAESSFYALFPSPEQHRSNFLSITEGDRNALALAYVGHSHLSELHDYFLRHLPGCFILSLESSRELVNMSKRAFLEQQLFLDLRIPVSFSNKLLHQISIDYKPSLL